VKAPVLNRVPTHAHAFGTDQIYYFKRRSWKLYYCIV
jgi:hypothetical protein